jgi:nitroreductase
MERRSFLVGGAAVVASAAGVAAWNRHHGLTAYAAYAAKLRRPFDPDGGVGELVRMATLAPNGHNTQAWWFMPRDGALWFGRDISRRTPVVDPDDHHIFVSLGAAEENIAIAGAAMGLPGAFIHHPNNGPAVYGYERGKPSGDPLVAAIVKRQSTRSVHDASAVDGPTLKALEAAGRREGVRLVLLAERKKIDAVRDLVITGNSAQMDDPAFVTELKKWLRFSPESAMAMGDGLYAAASGNPAIPDFAGRAAFDLVFKKASENDKYAKQIDSSAGLAVFFADTADTRGWITVGRAVQRFLLEATAHGLACAFINQPVEVARLRPQLAALVGEKDLRPDIVLRFGRARPLPYSPRRRVAEILIHDRS